MKLVLNNVITVWSVSDDDRNIYTKIFVQMMTGTYTQKSLPALMLETDYTLRSCQHGFRLLWKHSLLPGEWAEDGTSSSHQYSEAEVAIMEYMPDAVEVPCPFSFCSQHCLVTEACLLEPK